MKTSKDGYITFNQEAHEYHDIYGNQYQSVTTALKKFFPFESQEVAEKVSTIPSSIYFGQDVDSILEQWGESAPCGTGLHEACEKWINTGEVAAGEHEHGCNEFAKFFETLCGREKLLSEQIVYDERIMIAGTLDILQDEGDGYGLWDIKTSRVIEQMKLMQYSMQLELYRRFAERNLGCPVRTRGIVWFEGYFRNKQSGFRILRTIDCHREVNALIENRKIEIESK